MYKRQGNNTDTATNGGASVDYSYGSSWFIANGADEVVLQDIFSNEVDRVEYDGGPQFPDPTGASMALIDPALDNNLGENWCESTMTFGAGDSGTPGAANDCEPGGGGGTDPVARFIYEIQGSGNAVTEPGSAVIVEAVVIGDYQEADQLAGFFIQEESVDEDGDAATSEGILVFCGSCDTPVAEGNHVRVTGVQSEFFGMSQIDVTAEGAAVEVLDAGDNLAWVTPVSISLPAAQSTTSADTFEAVEGMLVTVENELTVTEYFQLGRFGQVVLSEGGRLRQFTDASSPSVAGYAAHLEDISRRQIILDDLNNNQNVDPVFHPQPGGFSADNVIRGGDKVSGLTAVMHWSWAGSGGTDAWRLRPQISNPVAFDTGFDRPESPDPVGGRLRVASFNVLNYFTTIDLTSSRNAGDCGPGATLDCRGADSDSELQRQTAKIVAAMSALDADIVGVIEIENNESESLQSLVAALNSDAGEDLYTCLLYTSPSPRD